MAMAPCARLSTFEARWITTRPRAKIAYAPISGSDSSRKTSSRVIGLPLHHAGRRVTPEAGTGLGEPGELPGGRHDPERLRRLVGEALVGRPGQGRRQPALVGHRVERLAQP